MKDRDLAGNQECFRCGRAFDCGMVAGAQRCWCLTLPRVSPAQDGGAACCCEACLRRLAVEQGVTADASGA